MDKQSGRENVPQSPQNTMKKILDDSNHVKRLKWRYEQSLSLPILGTNQTVSNFDRNSLSSSSSKKNCIHRTKRVNVDSKISQDKSEINLSQIHDGEIIIQTPLKNDKENKHIKSTKSTTIENDTNNNEVLDDSKIEVSSTENPNLIIDFGLNEFEEENNYITEAYNELGSEIVFTYIEVKRKFNTNHHSTPNDELLMDNLDSDMIFNQDDNSLQIIKDFKTNDFQIETNTNSSLENTNLDDNDENVLSQITTNLQRSISFLNSGIMDGKNKISYIVEEFIATEKQFISGLKNVQYKPFLLNKSSLPMNQVLCIFGNIEEIYNEATNFFRLIESNSSVDGINYAINKSAKMFDLYLIYSKNKPKSDYYLKKLENHIKIKQNELGDRLDLASYLLTPIQRLGKYILLLENIQKEQNKIGDFSSAATAKALNIIKNVMKRGNDLIAIDSIKQCPSNIDLFKQGVFVMREKFTMHKPKKIETMVFVFDKIVVFTENVISKNLETFPYIGSILMTDLCITSNEDDELEFQLSDYFMSKKGFGSNFTFVLEAKSSNIKKNWCTYIGNRLWEQLNQAKCSQKLLSESNGTHFIKPMKKKKDRKNTENQSVKRSSSIFYVDSSLPKTL